MDLSRPGSFLEADAATSRLQGSVVINSILDADEEPATPQLDISSHSRAVVETYFQRLFSLADDDKSGVLEKAEVQELLLMSGFNLDSGLVQRAVDAADLNADGVIDYSEFVPMMMNLLPGISNASVASAAPAAPAAAKGLDPNNYSKEQIENYFHRLFRVGDVNGDGTLDPEELECLLQSSGFNFSKSQVSDLMGCADINGDGKLDYAEFVPMMTALVKPQVEISLADHTPKVLETYFRRLFALADEDGSGVLEIGEVEELLLCSGFNLDKGVVAQLVDSADTNRDGVIQYEEFVPLMVAMLEGGKTLNGMMV
jgi:calmodulin